jgi:hypothetical protein
MNMRESNPYLSIVVTARNDDHGGSLLRRMQTFVNCWIGQAKRHGLRSELIVVEWNPPQDRPPLREALSWPADLGPCTVRFVEVPPEMHLRHRHAKALPLYQMIAKNVGIRRARAPFVLATNIDILFSDELVSYLAQGPLQANRMYRIDRLDVATDVPVDGSVDAQLRYCESHLIRCNTRDGTFSLMPDGRRALEKLDIAPAGCGVSFGAGWFPAESDGVGGAFRWLGNDAEVTVWQRPDASEPLTFEFEPGPSAGNEPMTVQAADAAGKVLAESIVTGRSQLSVPLPELQNADVSLHLHVTGGGLPISHDPRILNLRILRCGWGTWACSLPVVTKLPGGELWMRLMHAIRCLAQDGTLSIVFPERSRLRRITRAYVNAGGLTGALLRRNPPSSGRIVETATAKMTSPETATPDDPVASVTVAGAPRPAFLHTNGCGDFTLMARENWFDLRGYPEFDLFSMNLDSVLCHSAHHAGFREEILREPLRIYHIEHGTGSGWTPEGQAQLFQRLRARGIPWLDCADFVAMAEQMRRFGSPLIFNRENWGFAEVELRETTLPACSSIAAPSRCGRSQSVTSVYPPE